MSLVVTVSGKNATLSTITTKKTAFSGELIQ